MEANFDSIRLAAKVFSHSRLHRAVWLVTNGLQLLGQGPGFLDLSWGCWHRDELARRLCC